MVAIILLSFFNCVNLLGWVYQDSPSGDSKFEVFGPRADKLLIKLFPTAEDEWNALLNGEIDVTDNELTLGRYEQFTNASHVNQINCIESPGGGIGLFLIDINNNNNPKLGNPDYGDPMTDNNPVYPNPCSVLGMRKAVAYLCNRTHIVEDLASQFVFASPTYSCVPPTSPYSHSGITPGGSREDLCFLYSRTQANASLDASGFSVLDSEGWRMWDTTGQRVVLKFFIRNETVGSAQARFLAGNFIADELEACGVKIERTYGPSWVARDQVMTNKDFHLYTGGWLMTNTLDWLVVWNFKYYSHPGLCYGYDGCNNPEFNTVSDIAESPANESSAVAAGIRAQEVFAEDVLSVPLWTTKGYLAMNRRYQGTPGTPDGEDPYEGQYWEGVSPSYSDGATDQLYDADNCFTFLNMHPQGYPFGNGEMTIRYGLSRTVISSLNPIYANEVGDNKILNLIGYESLLKRDPYNSSKLNPWIANKWQVGTSPTNTNVSFSLRTDVCWSDGVPLTVEDVRFTLVELPRILSSRGLPQPYLNLATNIVDFRVTDPYNFEIMLNGISYWNALYTALSRILPEHVWRPIAETGDPTAFQPDPNMTATGPWKLEEFVGGDHLLLVPNPSFFKKEPIDCVASISNPGVRGQVVSNGTNVEFNVTVLNQCYGDAVNATVRVYVDSELLHTAQVTVDNVSSACLGPFLTGQLMNGLHVVRIECAPTEPAWLSQRPSQYEMPLYVTDVEDVNFDYYTNIQDTAIVCRAFASLIGDPTWNPKADIVYDYKIDIKDIVRTMWRASKREWPAPAPEPGMASIVLDTDYAEFAIGETFNLTVMIENAIDLAGYQFTLSYNTSTLDLTNVCPSSLGYQNPIQYNLVNDTYSESVGKYYQSCTTLSPGMSFSGSDLLATLTFKATQTGSSFFSLTNTLMIDSNANQIPHTAGYKASAYHDVALTDVRLSQGSATPGDLVGVQVDVLNNGTTLENVAITIYADADTSTIGDEQVIGTRQVILPSQASTTVEYVWDTRDAYPGNLVISAKATILLPDGNETNNMYVDGPIQIIPGIPDLAVTQVCPTQEALYVGDPVKIEVYMQNQGNRAETANFTLYSDTDPSIIGDEVTIGTRSIVIGRYSSLKEVFEWNTTGVAAGDYNLTACITSLASEVDVGDNNRTEGVVRLFESVPCPDVNVTCPGTLVVNPSIFTYDSGLQARLINIGNASIKSTGFEGLLRVVGSRNGTIRLCMNEPDRDDYTFYLPLGGEVQVPLWLVFQPETHWGSYDGTYTLNLTVCGTHRRQLTIKGISIIVCQNGAYIVNSETVSFSWNLTGGSLVYLEAEPDLPPGWTYSVDPPVGTFFETPQIVSVNITAPPDAKESDIGKVTLRAYKNATGQLIWQFIYFASASNKPPTIESITTPTVTPDGNLVLNATVSDPSGIMETVLHYSVDFGEWQNQTMQWMSGDTLNTTLYSGTAYYGTGPTTVRYYVSAVDWLGKATDSPVETVEVRNDIMVTGLTVENVIVSEMNHVQADITVRNNGTLPLSFANVAVYANSTLMATYTVQDLACNEDVSLDASLVLPKGNYIITAYAAGLPDEVDMSNNARMAGVYNRYDVTVSAVAASKTVVGQDYPMAVGVAIENRGNFTETFNITVYANATVIGSGNVTLPAGSSTTVSFTWDTTGFAYGNYSVSAYALPVEGETCTGDNALSGGTVIVSHMGDVTGDGKCDIEDLARVSSAYGSLRVNDPNDPRYGQYWHDIACQTCPHTPNADITNDGIVDIADLARTSGNFGWHE
jgi:ABC-type transport system substrate-binding protein